MELEFTLEKADLLEYNRCATKARSRAMRPRLRSLTMCYVWACVLIAVLGSFSFFDWAHFYLMPLFLVAMLLALLAMLLLLLAFVKPYLKRYYNIYYSPEFFPDMFVPQKMIFDSKMFVNIRQNSRAEYLWDGINEIMHTEAHTFILLPNTTGWIVPHRIFRNSTEIQGFKDQLEAFRNRGKSNTSTLLNASAK